MLVGAILPKKKNCKRLQSNESQNLNVRALNIYSFVSFLLGSDFLIMYVNAHEMYFWRLKFWSILGSGKNFVSPPFIFCTYITILSEPTFPIYVLPFAGILQHSSLCSGALAKKFKANSPRKTKCVYMHTHKIYNV